MSETLSEQSLAENCAVAMFDADQCSRSLGMVIEQIGPGSAIVAMRVTPAMLNGHMTMHGGMIFTLADSAFAFACNSRNIRNVAQHCSITFLSPAKEGERLVAIAAFVTQSGRSGIYDVTIYGGDQRVVAVFRGHSAALKETVLMAKNHG